MSMYGSISGAAQEERREIVKRLSSQVQKSSLQTIEEYQAGGIAEYRHGELVVSKGTEGRLKTTGAKQALTLALEIAGMGQKANTGDLDADAATLQAIQGKQGDLYTAMSHMDVKTLRETAGLGGSIGGQAAEMLATGQRMHSRMRSSQRRLRDRSGKLAAVDVTAQEMGLNLTKEQMEGLKGLSAEEQAARLASYAGAGQDESFKKGLKETLEVQGTGKDASQQRGALLSRTLAQADPDTKKKIMEAQGRGPDKMDKLAERVGEGNKFLEALVKSSDAAKNTLKEIAGNTSKPDAEA